MRNKVWIPLALSVLCSFFVSRDLDRISSFDSSSSQGKSAETTFESNEQTRGQSMQSTADDDVVASYSNPASFLSLLAPGEFVMTSSSSGGTDTSSGTSMATPPVTGSIASIREAIPGVTADEIDNALGLTGVPVLDTRNGITTPRIQLEDAIVLLESTQPDPGDPADPPPAEGSIHRRLERSRRVDQAPGVRITMSRTSVMSSIANFRPSRPRPLSLTPP